MIKLYNRDDRRKDNTTSSEAKTTGALNKNIDSENRHRVRAKGKVWYEKEQVEITFVAGHSHGWAVRYVTHRMRLGADESILCAIYVIVALGTNQQAAATGDRKRCASA